MAKDDFGRERQLRELGAGVLSELVATKAALDGARAGQQAIREHLAYRLGQVLVARPRSFWSIAALPWRLWRTWRAFGVWRDNEKRGKLADTSSHSTSGRWDVLATRRPIWRRVPDGPTTSLGIRLRLRSFGQPLAHGVTLLVRRVGPTRFAVAGQAAADSSADPTNAVASVDLPTANDTVHFVKVVLPDAHNAVECAVVSKDLTEPVYASLAFYPVDGDHDPANDAAHLRGGELVLDLAASPPCLPPSEGKGEQLRAVTLLDEFSEECLRDEIRVTPLSRAGWRQQLDPKETDCLLIEAAWSGNRGTWAGTIHALGDERGSDLRAVFKCCRELGIPTVFWNKEDPAHFDRFLNAAREFDHVLTTDQACVDRYRTELVHDRVALLPFAAQPRIHHPVRLHSRIPRVAFCGSWGAKEYPARARWLRLVLEEPLRSGVLDIYDRHAASHEPDKRFPDKYQSAVVGPLPYLALIEQAYRRYAVMLNVNSVTDSDTMMARRVFEMAACGAPIISTPSKAIEALLPSVVRTIRTESELRVALEDLLGDPLKALACSAQGVRLIHSRHTYRHRVDQIRGYLGLPAVERSRPSVAVICVSRRPERIAHVASQIMAQCCENVEVVVVCDASQREEEVRRVFSTHRHLTVLMSSPQTSLAQATNLALASTAADIIAKFDDDDYYGPNYLADALLAFDYSVAAVVGKASHFVHLEASNQLFYYHQGYDYQFTNHLHGATLVWDRRRTGHLSFPEQDIDADVGFLAQVRRSGGRLLSLDPFNFVHCRYASKQHLHYHAKTDQVFIDGGRPIGDGLDTRHAFL